MSKLEKYKPKLEEVPFKVMGTTSKGLTTRHKHVSINKVKQPKQTFKRKDDMKYRQIKQYAGVLLLAIGFIYAGLELVDRQPVQSVAVGILAFLLVETALQNKSK